MFQEEADDSWTVLDEEGVEDLFDGVGWHWTADVITTCCFGGMYAMNGWIRS